MYRTALIVVVAALCLSLAIVVVTGGGDDKVCVQKKLLCKWQNFYHGVPAKGYGDVKGCQAMKATYRCYLKTMSECLDTEETNEFQLWIQGNLDTCPDEDDTVEINI